MFQLNHEWAELHEKAEAKREELNSAHGVQSFHIECRETVSWIEDKKRILQSTDSLEMDLSGIMTLQVRLSFLSSTCEVRTRRLIIFVLVNLTDTSDSWNKSFGNSNSRPPLSLVNISTKQDLGYSLM